jgi:6-phosphogluconate dehydrogenase
VTIWQVTALSSPITRGDRYAPHHSPTGDEHVTEANSLRQGLVGERLPEPSALVVFGASGDLTKRQRVPAQAFASALAYFDGYRSASLPANLIQAQRDFFGAHTFERVDAPRGTFFHVDWPDPKRPQREVK